MAKLSVDHDACIGCLLCISLAPDLFETDEEGKSVPKKTELTDPDEIKLAKDVAGQCPANAIKVEE